MDAGNVTYQYVPWRGITQETMKFYEVPTKVDATGQPISLGFVYGNGRTKVRLRDKKEFYSTGSATESTGFLFGASKFAPGTSKAITITEGELDTLSAFQILGSRYPVVSVSGASAARADCTKDFDYLNSFDKIYICFDSDEAGEHAVQQVASLFDFNKIYHVKLDKSLKDANGYLTAGKEKDFVSAWWAAKRFLPENVLSSFSEFEKIIDEDVKKDSVPYPFETLQRLTYGIRTGEVVLLKAQEKIGKTEIMRAIEHHLLQTTDANIGVIHLEESKSRLVKGLAGYQLGQPVHLPDSGVSNEEIKKAFRDAVKRDERLHIYTHFGSDDPDVILNTIRFMAGACGCKYIFLDHITMVVTGLEDSDERKTLDYITTKLGMMVRELDFCLFLVSHVNDAGQTRGSRLIPKVADLIISLDRDILSEDAEIRNTTKLVVEGNRFASTTGPSGSLRFDPGTFMITEAMALPV